MISARGNPARSNSLSDGSETRNRTNASAQWQRSKSQPERQRQPKLLHLGVPLGMVELLDSFTSPGRFCGASFLLPTYEVAEAQCEDCAPAWIVVDADAAVMCLHDFHHNGKSKPCSRASFATPTPESLENMFPLLGCDPRAAIGHADAAFC